MVNWLLIFVGTLLILAEVLLGATTGFDLLLLGTAIGLGGGLGLLLGSPAAGLAASGVLALAYLFLGRKYVRRRLKTRGVESNADAMIGRTGIVVEPIRPHEPGRVQVAGEIWRAELADPGVQSVVKGQEVLVRRIDGVTLFVAVP